MFGLIKIIGKFVGLGLLALAVAGLGLLGFVMVPYFGNTAVIVRSNSMKPVLRAGDVIVVRPRAEGYEVGDIVAYESPNNEKLTVIHRVIDRSSTTSGFEYVTRGDAIEEVDPYLVQDRQVSGKQMLVVPYVGQVLAYGKTRWGLVGWVAGPVLLIIIGDGLYIWSEVRKHRKKKIEVNRRALADENKQRRLGKGAGLEVRGEKADSFRRYRRRSKNKMDSVG